MIKISWGTKIAMLYCGFVLLMAIMVAMCMRQNADLVSEDYYERELVFQNRISAADNANALEEKLTHVITDKTIQLNFPALFNKQVPEGEILFFRPSDASKDYRTQIQLNEQLQQSIPLKNLSKGMYKLQVSWKVNNTDYFNEEIIVIP